MSQDLHRAAATKCTVFTEHRDWKEKTRKATKDSGVVSIVWESCHKFRVTVTKTETVRADVMDVLNPRSKTKNLNKQQLCMTWTLIQHVIRFWEILTRWRESITIYIWPNLHELDTLLWDHPYADVNMDSSQWFIKKLLWPIAGQNKPRRESQTEIWGREGRNRKDVSQHRGSKIC